MTSPWEWHRFGQTVLCEASMLRGNLCCVGMLRWCNRIVGSKLKCGDHLPSVLLSLSREWVFKYGIDCGWSGALDKNSSSLTPAHNSSMFKSMDQNKLILNVYPQWQPLSNGGYTSLPYLSLFGVWISCTKILIFLTFSIKLQAISI